MRSAMVTVNVCRNHRVVRDCENYQIDFAALH